MIEKLQESLLNLKENKQVFYFFVNNKGDYPSHSVSHLYKVASDLRALGKKVQFVYITNEYVIPTWLPEAASFEHKSISDKLSINVEDFIILTEEQYPFMEHLKSQNIPSKRIVFIQEYEYLTDILPIGRKFIDVGVIDAITTSETMKKYLETYLSPIRCEVIKPAISSDFKSSEKPKKPEVVVYYRNPRDFKKAINLLALKKPFLSFVEFIDATKLSDEKLAEVLSEACLAVSLDAFDSSGTFFLQTLKAETDLVCFAPLMGQPFMNEKNAWWVTSIEDAMNVVEQYLQGFLQSTLNSEMRDARKETSTDEYTEEKRRIDVREVFDKLVEIRIKETEEIINQQIQSQQ